MLAALVPWITTVTVGISILPPGKRLGPIALGILLSTLVLAVVGGVVVQNGAAFGLMRSFALLTGSSTMSGLAPILWAHRRS